MDSDIESGATKTLMQVIDDASMAIDTFKHPSLDEFRERMHPVMQALGKGTLGSDKIMDIDWYAGPSPYLRISTEWSARGCTNSSDHDIPRAVLESPDPVRAAQLHRANEVYAQAKRKVEQLAADSEAAGKSLGEAERALQALAQPA